MTMQPLLKDFIYKEKTYKLFQAGLPGFPRNFTRDVIISTILSKDYASLREQLEFCALLQGQKKDPFTGEEEGKIFHEYPAFTLNGLSTLYNACDTTALFLIGIESYLQNTGDIAFVESLSSEIKMATNYILRHIRNNLFIEDPEFSDAKSYALKVTYWKDSMLQDRENGEPEYPVTYILAHIQNIAGLRAASNLLQTKDLDKDIEKMLQGLHILFDSKVRDFAIVKDTFSEIRFESSDLLHGLFYLQPGDLTEQEILAVLERSKILETEYGYRTNTPELCGLVADGYHTCTLWPFEQALIFAGGKKFGLHHPMDISARIIKFLDTDAEIFELCDDEYGFRKGGCDPQLWTIACKEYFRKELNLTHNVLIEKNLVPETMKVSILN